MDGTVREIAEGVELRFERQLAHPIEKVWAALTEPLRLSEWLAEGEIELRLGGRVYLKGDEIESTVTALDPPKLIQYGWKTAEWDGGEIRWELDPTQTGTRLVLTHVFTPPTDEEANELRETLDLPSGWDPLPSTLAGWHTILANLSSALDGAPRGSSLQGGKAMEGWQELNEHYKKVLVR